MKAYYCVAGVILAASISTSSLAAVTVESTGTSVSAVTRSGSVRIPVGSQVENQTRVVVARGPAGRETILRYEDGCEVRLRPGQVYTVLDVSPCTPAAPAETPAAGVLGAPVVIGGVIVAGALVGGIIAATSGGRGSGNLPVYISP